MKAIHLVETGSVDNFKVVDLPKPTPGDNEVLIKTKAVGVMFADIMQRRGGYIIQPELPFIPGKELSGVIESVGRDVKKLEPGMRVMAFTLIGAYAEYVTIPEEHVIILPDHVSFQQGLVYLLNMPVAYLAVHEFGKIQPGDTILLHAASGGIGSLITQIINKEGNNTLIALASSDEKLSYCKENGAEHCINYRSTDYVQEVLKITEGKGVDVIFNSVAGNTFKTDPHAIKDRGKWLIYGSSAGVSTIDLFEFILKSLVIIPFSVYTIQDSVIGEEMNQYRVNWLQNEKVLSPTKVFALEDIGAAHTWIENQKAIGKIVLEV